MSLACLFKGHRWVHLTDIDVYESSISSRPIHRKRVYQCTRCLKAKKVII